MITVITYRVDEIPVTLSDTPNGDVKTLKGGMTLRNAIIFLQNECNEREDKGDDQIGIKLDEQGRTLRAMKFWTEDDYIYWLSIVKED